MVQRLVGHADPAITTEVYGHLEAEDVRPHLERLDFSFPEAVADVLPLAANGPHGAPVVRVVTESSSRARLEGGNPEAPQALARLSENTKNKGPVPRPSPCGDACCDCDYNFLRPP